MKNKSSKSLKQLRNRAWKLFSVYVRSLNADWRGFTKCYTCGVYDHWRSFDAGHYIHSKLDYDQRNIHAQCRKCNRFLHGKLDNYTLKLIEELGMEGLQQLRKDAFSHPGYTRSELIEIIDRLKSYAKY